MNISQSKLRSEKFDDNNNDIVCSTNCKKQNSYNALYPRNMVGFRCIIVNTLNKFESKGADSNTVLKNTDSVPSASL